MTQKIAKWGVFGSIVTIFVLTVLEFPAPIGFETRPQANVSPLWLVLFLAIVVSEILAISLVLKKPRLGAVFAYVAAGLNIIQIIADQLHLMQPEIAPLGYTLLECSVGLVSLGLVYFAWKARESK